MQKAITYAQIHNRESGAKMQDFPFPHMVHACDMREREMVKEKLKTEEMKKKNR